jgi:hypothetical protein
VNRNGKGSGGNPSADVAFRIPIASTDADRHIPSDRWRILTLSNGTRSVAVAGHAGWDVFEVSKPSVKWSRPVYSRRRGSNPFVRGNGEQAFHSYD